METSLKIGLQIMQKALNLETGVWNAVSTVGHALFAACVIAAIVVSVKSFATGERVAGNPWIDGGAQ
jgi:intracellular septation protein A